MGEFSFRAQPHQLIFTESGSSEKFYVPCDLDEVRRTDDILKKQIQSEFEDLKDWDERNESGRQKVLRRLAEAGQNLLLAMDKTENAAELRYIISRVSKLTVDEEHLIAWEFLYLGDLSEPIDPMKFAGANIVIARWFGREAKTVRTVAPSRGKTLTFRDLYPVSEEDYEVLLVQDNDLASASLGRERETLSAHVVGLIELDPLDEKSPDSVHLLKKFVANSEILSHFNCHGLPGGWQATGSKELPDEFGRLTVAKNFTVNYPTISSLPLSPSSIVVLNTCYGADLSIHGTRCMAAAFSQKPGVTVIASYNKVEDGFATTWAKVFYNHLFGGSSVGDALLAARRAVLEADKHPAVLLYTLVGKFGKKLLPAEASETPIKVVA